MSAAEVFRALHASGCFVIPNPWDAGSAKYLHALGFKALATTSAGFGFSRGLPDQITAMPRDLVLGHLRDIVAATPLPVNADFQNGYADEPEGVAASVTLCAATGVAGLSIEDGSGDPSAPIYERELAIARVRAARAALDAASSRVVLTARCEAVLLGVADARRVVLDRLPAFAEAGADCLFAPGIRDLDTLAEVVRAVAPLPVNALVGAPLPGFTVARLAEIGVRRVSLGSALARAAWGAFMRAAQGLAAGGFEGLAGAASFAELNALFEG